MKNKICKIISILSLAPLIALYVLTAIYRHDARVFGGGLWYGISILFLTVLPISAYLLEHWLPAYKNRGRQGERKLAFVMCISGYVLGTAVSMACGAPRGVRMIFLSYLVSGGVLTLVNSAFKFKASGHACGTAGPYVPLMYFVGPQVWYVIFLLVPVYWARIAMGRHDWKELLSGTLIGMAASALTMAVFLRM
jgi:hypothetical protein